MSLIWIEGFELNAPKDDYIQEGWAMGAAAVTNSTSVTPPQPVSGFGNGTYTMRVADNTTIVGPEIVSGGVAEGGVTQWYRVGAYSVNNRLLQFINVSTILAYVRVNSSQVPLLYINGSLQATATVALTEDIWFHMGCTFEQHSSTGEMKLWINGDLVASVTGNTGTTTNWDRIGWRMGNTTNSHSYADAIAIYDDVTDDFQSETFAQGHKTTGDDTDGSFVKSTDSNNTDLYTMVDDKSNDSADTTTDPDTCRFTMEDRSDINADYNPATILGIASKAVVAVDGGFSTGQMILEDNSVDSAGTAHTVGATDEVIRHIDIVSPDTSTAFTGTQLDGLIVGITLS